MKAGVVESQLFNFVEKNRNLINPNLFHQWVGQFGPGAQVKSSYPKDLTYNHAALFSLIKNPVFHYLEHTITQRS